jgi:N-acyl-L-homoserine lactone synthetase
MDQEGQIVFEWDLRLGEDSEERDTYDTDNPWYIPGFED